MMSGMTTPAFQRARSAQAKQAREEAILDAARALARERGVRDVTLTDIAGAVGMHKSALLRYFETREQIFLRLTAEGWRQWSAELRGDLERRTHTTAPEIAEAVAATLAARPMFCDLLAQAPMNLERNVSIDSVRDFKLVTFEEIGLIGDELRRLLGLTELQTVDLVATATSLAGALRQMAAPGPRLRELYETDPRLGHAIVEVEPRLRRVLTAFLSGLDAEPSATGSSGA
ncbi:TetR family transcriptional regulator [Streptomyces rapamycinicus NRRL 5491]|uniref:TetR family transcriptional regulator n=2 Tax=Streptomyces rapamycinicus TaxID=1226757 RepID=A0A3L8RQ93_STRRN|nr:TetR family transcriptional regulator [Streptomyces rapamycinicus NRRL 5491]